MVGKSPFWCTFHSTPADQQGTFSFEKRLKIQLISRNCFTLSFGKQHHQLSHFFFPLKFWNKSKLQIQPLKLPDKTHITSALLCQIFLCHSSILPHDSCQKQENPATARRPRSTISQHKSGPKENWGTKVSSQRFPSAAFTLFLVLFVVFQLWLGTRLGRVEDVELEAGMCSRGGWITGAELQLHLYWRKFGALLLIWFLKCLNLCS